MSIRRSRRTDFSATCSSAPAALKSFCCIAATKSSTATAVNIFSAIRSTIWSTTAGESSSTLSGVTSACRRASTKSAAGSAARRWSCRARTFPGIATIANITPPLWRRSWPGTMRATSKRSATASANKYRRDASAHSVGHQLAKLRERLFQPLIQSLHGGGVDRCHEIRHFPARIGPKTVERHEIVRRHGAAGMLDRA